MRPEDLRNFLRQKPFRPFRVTLTDGRIYEIRHPEARDRKIIVPQAVYRPLAAEIGTNAAAPRLSQFVGLCAVFSESAGPR